MNRSGIDTHQSPRQPASKKLQTVLIVEDDAMQRQRLGGMLQPMGYAPQEAADTLIARTLLAKQSFDWMITDLYFSEDDDAPAGVRLLQHVADQQPTTKMIAISSDATLDIYEKAKSSGALHFIRKPLSNASDLAVAMQFANERFHLLRKNRLPDTDNNQAFVHGETDAVGFNLVLTADQLKIAETAAKHGAVAVTLYGETGTGKEEIARLVHNLRQRIEGPLPFIPVNCANLSPELMESLMFGHRRGAFSGAEHSTTGFVGEAHGGILFLDEIHTLPMVCQSKLLRVLNDGCYTRLGDTAVVRSQFQLIVASTKDLDSEVDDGRLLLDLRTRVMGLELTLLPLRQRFADLQALIKLCLKREKFPVTEKQLQQLTAKCCQFYWRGNIRQLYKVLQAMIINARMNDFEELDVEGMPVYKTMLPPQGNTLVGIESASNATGLQPNEDFGVVRNSRQTNDLAAAIDALLPNLQDLNLAVLCDTVESRVIAHALQRFKKVVDASAALGISRNTLDLKRKKYDLKD